MRDFNFNDTPRTTEAGIAGVRPAVLEPDQDTVLLVDRQDDDAFRPSHTKIDDDESGNNTAKIVGGIFAGLLIIGGGIYAYETSTANSPAHAVAMNTAAPAKVATAQPNNPPAVEPPATATDTTAAPSQSSPDGVSPSPSRAPSRTIERADNSDAASAQASAPQSDAAINTPMTQTPESAPPAEQSAPVGQTAMQQPVTAPDVSGQTSQPTPALANNDVAGMTLPADNSQVGNSQASPPAQDTTPAQAPADQPAQQTIQPQLAPAQ